MVGESRSWEVGSGKREAGGPVSLLELSDPSRYTGPMALFDGEQLAFAKAVSQLTYCNPFLPERIDGERKALGDRFIEVDPVWHRTAEGLKDNPNIDLLVERVQSVADRARAQLVESPRASLEELTLY